MSSLLRVWAAHHMCQTSVLYTYIHVKACNIYISQAFIDCVDNMGQLKSLTI